ncbi:MAG: hypothetical protein NUW37_19440 [Planctomycetes bacterium]|nr:hypothetical protein [Planctomycetota bacterium]
MSGYVAIFENVKILAIAISEPIPGQRHVGILHRYPDEGELKMLHLQGHHKLSEEIPTPDSKALISSIDEERLVQIAAKCRRIWRANENGKIPYGFSLPTGCFDRVTLKFLIGESKLGLTCASFVLAVFESAGFPLVDYNSWPTNREDDQNWRGAILYILSRDKNVPRSHIDAISSDVGKLVRFRPEEVAGAFTSASHPAPFEVAEPRSREVLALVTQMN